MNEFDGSREEWGEAVIEAAIPYLTSLGIEPPGDRNIRIAIAPLRGNLLGLCYSSGKSLDGNTNLITLSSDQGEPLELVHTCIHELLHAWDDCNSGHRGRWKRWADTVGIAAQGHDRTPLAEDIVQSVLEMVGLPTRHVQTQSRKSKRKPAQIKAVCPECQDHVHMPTSIAERGDFQLTCVQCQEHLVLDLEPLLSWQGGVA